jgi:replicative DNA helicase
MKDTTPLDGNLLKDIPLPRTLRDIMVETDRKVAGGLLEAYTPLPSGFRDLDDIIGGGFKQGELILLGGAQGLGKTIWALQVARNIAAYTPAIVVYLSYEHDEEHMLSRLLCMESIDPTVDGLQRGLRLKDLHRGILSYRQRNPNAGFFDVLKALPQASPVFDKLQLYLHKLYLLKASPQKTTLPVLQAMVQHIQEQNPNVPMLLVVDYLQKIPLPYLTENEAEKVTIVVEGLKNIALAYGIVVLAIVASDREGLKALRLHLRHLRGSSALDYECDIALIMNQKWKILSKKHITFNIQQAEKWKSWVVFSVEKNRAGRAEVDLEFEMHSEYFCFNPHGGIVEQTLIDEKVIAE